jgi:hypothetical protein
MNDDNYIKNNGENEEEEDQDNEEGFKQRVKMNEK